MVMAVSGPRKKDSRVNSVFWIKSVFFEQNSKKD